MQSKVNLFDGAGKWCNGNDFTKNGFDDLTKGFGVNSSLSIHSDNVKSSFSVVG